MYAVNKRDDIGVRALKYAHVGGWCERRGGICTSARYGTTGPRLRAPTGRNVSRQDLRKDTKESGAFRIPQSTVGSIILKWKMLGTARNLSRAAWAISPSLQRRIGRGGFRTGSLIRVEAKLIGAKYRNLLNVNLIQSVQDHRHFPTKQGL